MSEYIINNGFIIAVEGLIGVGKSTMCSLIKNYLITELTIKSDRIVLIFDSAINSALNLLKKFYQDQRKYAYILQKVLENHRFSQLLMAKDLKEKGYVVIIDQSLLSDIIFAKANRINFSEEEWNSYFKMYNEHIEMIGPIDLVIYLSSTIKTSIERISSRGRNCEQNIPIPYFQKLHDLYEEMFLSNVSSSSLSFNYILKVDWNVFRNINTEPWIRKMKSRINRELGL